MAHHVDSLMCCALRGWCCKTSKYRCSIWTYVSVKVFSVWSTMIMWWKCIQTAFCQQ